MSVREMYNIWVTFVAVIIVVLDCIILKDVPVFFKIPPLYAEIQVNTIHVCGGKQSIWLDYLTTSLCLIGNEPSCRFWVPRVRFAVPGFFVLVYSWLTKWEPSSTTQRPWRSSAALWRALLWITWKIAK